MRSSSQDDWVGVPAAVIDPGADVRPGVACHLLSLDLQQHVLRVLERITINIYSLNRINEFYVSEL